MYKNMYVHACSLFDYMVSLCETLCAYDCMCSYMNIVECQQLFCEYPLPPKPRPSFFLYEQDSLGSSACSQCPIGTYSDQKGNVDVSSCLSCPPLMSSPAGSVSLSACICAKGYTGEDGKECYACVPGTYKGISGSSPCTLCPFGKFSAVLSATSGSSCNLCQPGKYSDLMGAASENACIACPMAKFSDIPGSTTVLNCELCIQGTYSNTAGGNSSSACVPCDVGTFAATDGNEASPATTQNRSSSQKHAAQMKIYQRK